MNSLQAAGSVGDVQKIDWRESYYLGLIHTEAIMFMIYQPSSFLENVLSSC